MTHDVLIIGAGVAGLRCAQVLHKNGVSATLLDSADAVGGRIRTDVLDGFQLDRGFQVLLTAYPEVQAAIDYNALNLRTFFPGAIIRRDEKFIRIADPVKAPLKSLEALFASIGTLKDKVKIPLLRQQVKANSVEKINEKDDISTLEALRNFGFSDTMIDVVFRSFLGGIFLEKDLVTSRRKFEFVFKMFYEGDTAVPAMGMEAIPKAIAKDIPRENILLNTKVVALETSQDGTSVTIEHVNGEQQTLTAKKVVLACDAQTARTLAPNHFGSSTEQTTSEAWSSTACVYFSAPKPPTDEKILVLNGTGKGLLNNITVMSNVAPEYAPEGQALLSASTVGIPDMSDEEITKSILKEARQWYGSGVDTWKHLRTYRIPEALPAQPAGSLTPPTRSLVLAENLYVCGDHRSNASINGAMATGREVAEVILAK